MEKILVGVDVGQSGGEGVKRAIQLATRIDARVSILLVSNPQAHPSQREVFQDLERSVRQRLEMLIQAGRVQGVEANLFMTQGDYLEEVIRFIHENEITLVVFGLPRAGSRAAEEFDQWLTGIRHRISCRIELVHEKESSYPGSKLEKAEGRKPGVRNLDP
jgi:nucleotide-binding universal stress UspA family protein